MVMVEVEGVVAAVVAVAEVVTVKVEEGGGIQN